MSGATGSSRRAKRLVGELAAGFFGYMAYVAAQYKPRLVAGLKAEGFEYGGELLGDILGDEAGAEMQGAFYV